jgi:dTDP-4-amino-4,6-dideoxygalactose transaminase
MQLSVIQHQYICSLRFAKYGWRRGQFPVSESLARELLCLPMRPDMGESEVVFVTSKLKQFFANDYARSNAPRRFVQ